jgi:hypothetical protein
MRRSCVSLLSILVVGLGVVALACSSSPTPRFYALNAIGPEEAPASTDHLGVVVGPINIPRYLQRPQIVSRKGDSRLHYDEFNRWGGSLESEILRVLGENLGVLLGTDRIIVYPRRAVFPTRYGVRLDFERFDGQRGEDLVLKVRWVVLPAGGGDAVHVEVTTLREPLDGSGVQELVRAHSAALAGLSRTIATRIGQLEAASGVGSPPS